MNDYRNLVGQGCQVVMFNDGVRIKFCDEPSLFVRLGIVPEDLTPKQAAEKHYNYTLLMCPHHADRYIHDMHWFVKDRRVRIERMDVTKLRLKCDHCFNVVTIQWDDSIGYTGNPGVLAYCPRCGREAGVAYPDAHIDFMDWVAEIYAPMSRQLIEMLYAEWPRNKYTTFREYIDAQIDAYDTTGELVET